MLLGLTTPNQVENWSFKLGKLPNTMISFECVDFWQNFLGVQIPTYNVAQDYYCVIETTLLTFAYIKICTNKAKK